MDQVETGIPRELRALCETLRSSSTEVSRRIIEDWGTIGEAEPWHELPPDVGFDHLPQLIGALADGALCTDFDRDRCREVVRIAAQHGDHRGREGFEESLVYREYHLLRRALWQQMKEERGEKSTVYYATMRVDALISLANAASLHGLNRPALEQEDRWPDALEELLDGWPLPVA